MRVEVLRLGHRYGRDKRISTHIGLVARAFGAQKLVFDVKDPEVEESIRRVEEEWGQGLEVSVEKNWKRYLSDFPGMRIHLTMYGLNLDDCIDEIRTSSEDKLIVIGGKKVPSEVYEIVDFNVAVGNQPHSEVAALAVFLDRLFAGKELSVEFKGKKKVVPQARGKKVLEFS